MMVHHRLRSNHLLEQSFETRLLFQTVTTKIRVVEIATVELSWSPFESIFEWNCMTHTTNLLE